ncbi:hypothetical protein [Streptomyces cyaneofuscatus]|uniref:hypothetical protein n=1 Tax=Streptomyces cyaneofuscatus TaxID=66883 RepID=UPI00364D2D8A
MDAIVAFVAGVQDAQRNARPDAFLSDFREDAIWPTAHGPRPTAHGPRPTAHGKRLTGLPESVPGTPTYVLAKDDGVWRIAAAQNTSVIDAETLTAG